jgi:hypothetical protein
MSTEELKQILFRAYKCGNENFAELSDEFVEEIIKDCGKFISSSNSFVSSFSTVTTTSNSDGGYYISYATPNGASPPSLGEMTLWS